MYFRIRHYFLVTDFNRKHLIVSLDNGKFSVSFLKHEDFVGQTEEKIRQYQEENGFEKTIEFALKEAIRGCNFIIFQDTGNKKRFLQFWTGKGKVELDFPILKTNGLKKYKYSILGLLALSGFADGSVPQPSILSFSSRSSYYYFYISEVEGMEDIKASFRHSFNLAANFTQKVFKEIYKTDFDNISIIVN